MDIETKDSERIKALFTKTVKRLGITQMRTVIRNLKKKKDRGNMCLKQSGSLPPYYEIFAKSKFYKSLTVDNVNQRFQEALTGLEQIEEEKVEEVKDEIFEIEEVEEEQESVLYDNDSGADDSDDEESQPDLQGEINTLKRLLSLQHKKCSRYKSEILGLNKMIQSLVNNN